MWYINYFHLQILAIELLFCARLQRQRHFCVRLILSAGLYCALPAIVPGGFFASFLTLGWFTFGFLAMLVLSGLLIAFCFRMSLRQFVF